MNADKMPNQRQGRSDAMRSAQTSLADLAAQQTQLLAALFDRHPSQNTSSSGVSNHTSNLKSADFENAQQVNDLASPSLALFEAQSWPQATYWRGLQAYRSNAGLLSERVLAAAYPTVQRMMGEIEFSALSRHFWRTHPPIQGDLAQWGAGLAEFFRNTPDLMAHEPYWVDLAELEWAMHAGQTAADDAQTQPRPLALIESQYPIVDWVQCKESTSEADPSEQAASLTPRPQHALVYRLGLQTACVALTPEQSQELYAS